MTALAPVLWQNEPVSSSRIRRCLAEGDTEQATALLGTPYTVGGKPVRQGRFLTLRLPPEMAVPADGTYHGEELTLGDKLMLTVQQGEIRWVSERPADELVKIAFGGRK